MSNPTKLRHMVLFGFKTGVSQAQIAELVARFRALKDLIPGVDEFECGIDVSPEALAQGHTHCFLLTFASQNARDAYLPHSAHQAFVSGIEPIVEKALVVDYWAT